MRVQSSVLGYPSRRVPKRQRGRQQIVMTAIHYLILSVLVFLTFFVFLVMVSMSLRPSVLIYADFWHLIPWPFTFANYQVSLISLLPSMGRTLAVASVSILGILIISSPAAYAFARIRFVGKDLFYYGVLAVMLIPGIILLTPNYILANQLNLRGSLQGLVVFYIAGGLPFAIFLLTTFFQSQPEEIFSAARVDGASEIQSLLRIALPLAVPILVTVCVLNFISIYGDFIWPSLLLPQDQQTIILALQQYSPTVGQYASRPDLGAQTAGYVVATLPQLILFIFALKYFIQGLTSSAIKA